MSKDHLTLVYPGPVEFPMMYFKLHAEEGCANSCTIFKNGVAVINGEVGGVNWVGNSKIPRMIIIDPKDIIKESEWSFELKEVVSMKRILEF
ncbi:hypothetical protein GOP47_0014389 [Adiantum capillus-veneris]|uniref:Uncharacterized protein n=1 Tax=Adiantum capillus-veneris TaxID=13818 RepID=A0A9D4ZET5_ADICA|nr:hypothetical protein GOP47_0014389 [Adiantum capillus-veneris]